MKAYLFSTENGLYEGETFVAADKLGYEDGMTRVAPPPHETGTVPVFDVGRQQWTVMPISLFRERFLGEEREKP